jgi:hypothetical protein
VGELAQITKAFEGSWPPAFNGIFRSDLPAFLLPGVKGRCIFSVAAVLAGSPTLGWKQGPSVLIYGRDSIIGFGALNLWRLRKNGSLCSSLCVEAVESVIDFWMKFARG